jgi:hypothetical protein
VAFAPEYREFQRKPEAESGPIFPPLLACLPAPAVSTVPTMTVYRRKDHGNAWAYEFVLNGQRYRSHCLDADGQPVTTRTAAQAVEIAAKAATQQAHAVRASGIKPGSYTLTMAAVAYLNRKRGRTASHLNNARFTSARS